MSGRNFYRMDSPAPVSAVRARAELRKVQRRARRRRALLVLAVALLAVVVVVVVVVALR